MQWFPMRVTYHRDLKIKVCFDKEGIESFLPMRYELVENGMERERKLVPAIHNLIFIHSTQEQLTKLKMERTAFSPIRYIMKPVSAGEKKILVVPDEQMENFIRAATVQNDSIRYLECNDFINKIGKKVRITAGQFKGVCGVIKRIKKNKYVVVQIEGLVAIAITYVPSCFLEEINNQ